MRPIIKVENLSKQFRIQPANRPAVRYDTLRESLVEAVRSPLRRARTKGKPGDDRIWALKDVSFEVMPGEVMGVIGANGAGKSTLLSVLSRIIEPTAGRAELFGRVACLLEVGTGFHPDLSGRENIYLNGAVLGMKRREIEEHFDEIVAFAEVEKFIDTAVKRYSSGMYVRLAFAVAAHLNPEILLVDEVLAVGDASFQRKCLGKMDEVTQNGRTILLVTHNLSVIPKLCERAIFLRQGQVGFCGPAQEALDCYITAGDGSPADG
ncbi:MAG: ABC transporter ATP-binding protein [Acidobacteriota bacterium]